MANLRVRTLVAATLLLGLVSSADGQMFRRVSRHSDIAFPPSEDQLAPHAMQRRWYALAAMEKGTEHLKALHLYEGERLDEAGERVRDSLLFAQSNRGTLYCYDGETGELRWDLIVDKYRRLPAHPPAVTEDLVFVNSGIDLLIIDRDNGRILETRRLPGPATTGPAISPDFIYVQIGEFFYAFDRKAPQYQFTKYPVDWFYRADGLLRNPPMVFPDRVVFASEEGTIYAMYPNARRFYFRFLTRADLTGSISSLGSILFVPSYDFSLYAIDGSSKYDDALRWRYVSGSPIRREPVPLEDTVYVTPEGSGLHAVDIETGKRRWINARLERVVAGSEDRIHGFTRTGEMVTVDRKTGETISIWSVPRLTLSTTNVYSDRLFLAAPDGLVVCLSEAGRNEPYLHTRPEVRIAEPVIGGQTPVPVAPTDAPAPEPEDSPAPSIFDP